MCHDDDSRPPAPPDPGPVAGHGPLTLTSGDGSQVMAYEAVPQGVARAGIVILPDVRGLHPYYRQLAVRFAEAGFQAVAIDWFARTLGPGPRDEVPDWQALIAQVRADEVALDVAAAAQRLRRAGVGPVFTVGFCFGGSQSWRLAATDLDLAGCIGFYGRPALLADVEPALRKPLLLLVAGADRATPLAESEALGRRLAERGQAHELHVYPGAPHSFFDRAFEQWQPACADAWTRILAFTRTYAAPTDA